MKDEHAVVMEYVYKHPYHSIADIANALNIAISRTEEIINDLHGDWKVLIIREHFVPLYGCFVPYDSPLVEPETESK